MRQAQAIFSIQDSSDLGFQMDHSISRYALKPSLKNLLGLGKEGAGP